MKKKSVRVTDLGRRPYDEVWQMQKRLVEERAGGRGEDTLILVEHEHVITLGRKTSPENFRTQEVPVFQVERGGDATYHGPGQLVGYPIVRMEVPDVRQFVRSLEAVVIEAVGRFSIQAERKEGHPGVWVDAGKKKLASIGVAVTSWVTYHGFALNVNTDLAYFQLIRPCGLDPETMTSMQAILGRPVEMELVKSEIKKSFSEVFAVEVIESTRVQADDSRVLSTTTTNIK